MWVALKTAGWLLFQQLVNTTFYPAFLRQFVYQAFCCGHLQIQTFYQNLVLVAE